MRLSKIEKRAKKIAQNRKESLKSLVKEYKAVREMRNQASRTNDLLMVSAHEDTLTTLMAELNKFAAAEVMAVMKG